MNAKDGKRIWLCEEGNRATRDSFLKAGTTLYAAAGALGGGIALEARTGKVRWTWVDNTDATDNWQIALSGNRLLVTGGQEVYAMPAV
ncbi:hypothetical protein AQI88_10120 [Streptomyces cellostaticus]|uniref:Ricin B lectin domain-containing protein n=1 Tax=Streptomyces cellostaticus TaxID=67285 RepID=A0A101NPL8_9ACTN|nr:hypothetical protein [Streptomyces cellostaticus]KUM96837.1 hypothetical protein AQI88_10120 [Streptomyces cellostaticus]GHI05738.1 hypothetical protein Scel_40590 [Streptomyces cellostaticus]